MTPDRPDPPSATFGALFEAVQTGAVFRDSKPFADATPRASPTEILTAYRQRALHGSEALRAFVGEMFELPPADPDPPDGGGKPLRAHIRTLWPALTRTARPRDRGSLLAFPARHVVAGGRFAELYYWDTYFTLLGLVADGQDALVEDTIDGLCAVVARFGFVPNGLRSYYLGRSQPPVLALMVGLSRDLRAETVRRRLAALMTEHGFWMAGADDCPPGSAVRRVVRLADGTLLNRYWDDGAGPRDEAMREDLAVAAASPRPASELFRDIRAAAESGWDFSSRWMGADRLDDTRTTDFAPVDLNCLVYLLERAIARHAASLGDTATAGVYEQLAVTRGQAIRRYCWSDTGGCFGDLRWPTGELSPALTAAALFPLFAGLSTRAQAAVTAGRVRDRLLAPGGLRTTEVASGEQWDAPNGWAPLQWIAVRGLARFGHWALAREVATSWIATVDRHYRATGEILEKYDVDAGVAGGGGEYPVQTGFGWTNGVTAALIDEFGA